MSFSTSSPKYPPVSFSAQEPVIVFDHDKMVAKAKEFANEDSKLAAYIENLLKHPGFKKDPKHFINNWEFRILQEMSLDETERSAHLFILQQPEFHRGAPSSCR